MAQEEGDSYVTITHDQQSEEINDAVHDGSGNVILSMFHSNDDETNASTSSNTISDEDKKPRAREDDDEQDDKSHGNANSHQRQKRSKASNSESNNMKDSRFLCAICLDSVSNEPVVTRCGHLYCWTCLYTWLEPGMILSEYYAAFGGGPPINNRSTGNGSNENGGPSAGTMGGRSTSRGVLNQFLSEMTSSSYNNHHHQSSFSNANYSSNIHGQPYNPQRRRCPVCKADCTVDSVIPIYIHVHASSSPSVNDVDDDSCVSLSRDNASNDGNGVQSASVARSNTFAQHTMEEDPTTSVNLGLRQRRRRTSDSATTTAAITSNNNATINNTTTSICDTPIRQNSTSTNEQNILSGFDDLVSPANSATPIHRNSSSSSGDGGGDGPSNVVEDTVPLNNMTPSRVPSRPLPTSPWVTNRTTVHPESSFNPTSPPNIRTRNANEASSGTIGTSSPFRLALRPRYQPHTPTPPPASAVSRNTGASTQHPNLRPASSLEQQQRQNNVPYSHAYSHHHPGRLTSVLLGIVDTVDNLAVSHAQRRAGMNNASTRGEATTTHGDNTVAAPMPVVPPLHRSDGGLGGIGRASEDVRSPENSISNYNGGNSTNSNNMSPEESSLAMAREFLSRLLLMLACFVVLCLLLF